MAWCSPSLQRRPGITRPVKLIHNHNFAIADDVVNVLNKEFFGLNGIKDIVRPGIFGVERDPALPETFSAWMKPSSVSSNITGFFVNLVVFFAVEGAGDFCRLGVLFAGALKPDRR